MGAKLTTCTAARWSRSNWCVREQSRLQVLNPFDPVAKANEKADLRRATPIMEPELVKLQPCGRGKAADWRLTRVSHKAWEGEHYANMQPENAGTLRWLGGNGHII